jgi:hypothetical protein
MLRQDVLLVVAATVISAALILPTSGVVAQNWTTVTMNHMPIVNGSGRVVQQGRNVGSFDAVETLGSENVDVRFGPKPSLVIAADDNILPLLTTEVKDGKLKIGTSGSFRMRGPIRVWITTPNLEAFTTSGSGDVVLHDVSNGQLSLTMNGSGSMTANGRTGRLHVTINGSGRAQLASLSANDVSAGLFGSGNATVNAHGRLDAQIFGSGSLHYIGKPTELRSSHFGSGRILASN